MVERERCVSQCIGTSHTKRALFFWHTVGMSRPFLGHIKAFLLFEGRYYVNLVNYYCQYCLYSS